VLFEEDKQNPYVKAVGGDVVERRFHLLLDNFLEYPNILVAIDFDWEYVGRIFAEDLAIQQEQGRRWSTNYCE